MATPEGLDVKALAHDIIDAHGSGAAELARENPRTAILSGRIAQAKPWLKVLAMFQGQQAARVGIGPAGTGGSQHTASSAFRRHAGRANQDREVTR